MTTDKNQKADTTTSSNSVTKALYAAVGAPVVAGRRAKALGGTIGGKLAGYGTKVTDGFTTQYSSWADEGEVVTKQLQDRKVVDDVKDRVDDVKEKVDLEHLQERVGKLRQQLEHTMVQWRDSFTPATKPAGRGTEKAATSTETTATSTETEAAAKKPAAKATKTSAGTAKKSAAKTSNAATKKPAAKKVDSNPKAGATNNK